MTEQRTKSQQYAGMVFLLVVLCSLGYVAWWLSGYMEDEQQAPIQDVLFSGNIKQLDIVQAKDMLLAANPGSFFLLDVNEVHHQIEAMPWVYQASVRKKWPNTLYIHIREQEAVANWNEDLLLNPFGESFPANVVEPLPNLYGPGGSEPTVLQGYKAIQALLNTVGLNVSDLFLSERYAWQVNLDNGIRLNLGRTEFIDRVQRFVDIYPLLEKNNQPVKYVDLRYDTGLAVGWQQDENEAQTES